MTDKPDINNNDALLNEDEPSPEELRLSTRFAEAVDALESGQSGLDALPNLDPNAPEDDELVELISLTQLMRSAGSPSGSLSSERQDQLWSSLEVALPPIHAQVPSRRRLSWRWLIAGFAGALAAAFVVVFVLQSQRTTVSLEARPERGPVQHVALLEVEHEQARYAAEIMQKKPEPLGDTRMRNLRQARFDAYRSDVRRHHRGVPGDAP